MEGTNIEKERFQKKANGYSKALKLVPYARDFEIIPILNILNDFLNKSDLSKNSVRIVELMAGSGFLTNHLINAGFKNIDVFEVSPDMVNNISINNSKRNNINIHPISDITEIEEHLKQIKPNIIISLAGYHHLIDYNDDKSINIDKSIDYQKRVTDICINSVAIKHLVLIIDIFSDDILKAQPMPVYWKKKRYKFLLPSKLIPNKISTSIYNSENIEVYSSILFKNFINPASKNNSAIKWFRNVIDKYTIAGHKDIAINKKFIKELKKDYLVKYSSVYTPWIFKDRKQLNDYIKTFWFLEKSSEKDKLKEIFDLIDVMNLSRTIEEGTTFFNWELTYITVQKKDINLKSSFLNKSILYLIFLILFLLIGIFIKRYTHYYTFTTILDKIIWITYGVLLKEIIFPKIKALLPINRTMSGLQDPAISPVLNYIPGMPFLCNLRRF